MHVIHCCNNTHWNMMLHHWAHWVSFYTYHLNSCTQIYRLRKLNRILCNNIIAKLIDVWERQNSYGITFPQLQRLTRGRGALALGSALRSTVYIDPPPLEFWWVSSCFALSCWYRSRLSDRVLIQLETGVKLHLRKSFPLRLTRSSLETGLRMSSRLCISLNEIYATISFLCYGTCWLLNRCVRTWKEYGRSSDVGVLMKSEIFYICIFKSKIPNSHKVF